MNRNAIRKFIFLFTTLFVLLACQLPIRSQPATPNPAPGSIGTVIFQTAVAAQTQTAILLPPSQTPALQLPPTGTPTETATSTVTFVFVLPTSTKPFEPYKAGSGCELIALTPNNPILAPREIFETNWALKNTSNKLWLDKNIDFKHSSGTDMHRTDVYDLPKSVAPDDQVVITVPMFAPRQPGTYTSTWVLASKQNTFCKVSVTVIVK